MRREKQSDGSYKIFFGKMEEIIVPVASIEKVKIVEDTIYQDCHPLLGKIADMDEPTFMNFLNDKAMQYDVERGIGAGQIPHIIYEHSVWFDEFETKLWKEINAKLDTVSDDFYKIN